MDYLSQIAQQGFLGIFLALSLLTNAFLFRELRSETNKRFLDAEQSRDTTRILIEGIKQSVDLVLTLMQSQGGRRK